MMPAVMRMESAAERNSTRSMSRSRSDRVMPVRYGCVAPSSDSRVWPGLAPA